MGVNAVELTHSLREIGIGSLDDTVIVVRHLAIDVAAPVETSANRAEHGEPIRAVLLFPIDDFASITARGDMIEPIPLPTSLAF